MNKLNVTGMGAVVDFGNIDREVELYCENDAYAGLDEDGFPIDSLDNQDDYYEHVKEIPEFESREEESENACCQPLSVDNKSLCIECGEEAYSRIVWEYVGQQQLGFLKTKCTVCGHEIKKLVRQSGGMRKHF